MNLHSDKEAFKEIIALAAEHFGYEQSHVEKDYWVSKILVHFETYRPRKPNGELP